MTSAVVTSAVAIAVVGLGVFIWLVRELSRPPSIVDPIHKHDPKRVRDSEIKK